MNYVFYIFSQWLFTYLVEERGFTLLESGFLYAMPFMVGAVLAAIGGAVCDALCKRIGPRWGCRLPAVVGLLLVAVLLLAGAQVSASVRGGGAAVAVLRIHAVHRRAVLGRFDVRGRAAHGLRHRRAQHGRQSCRAFSRPSWA